MSRTLDTWKAKWTSVGLGYRPCLIIPAPAETVGPYKVTIQTEMRRPDKRRAEIEMTPDNAEALGRSLIEYADKVRALNQKYGR